MEYFKNCLIGERMSKEHQENNSVRSSLRDWLGIAKSIKNLLQFKKKYPPWRYDENVFGWGLNQSQIGKLNEFARALEFNCTSRYRQVIKGFTRFGPFYHICLQFPCNHGEYDFSYHRLLVLKYKRIVSRLIENLFPDYKIGYYIKASRQQTDTRMPETHFHIVLSSIRYRKEDISALDRWKGLPEKAKPYHALWFLTDPIMLSLSELTDLIEEKWSTAIEQDTCIKISKQQKSLVCVTGYEAQTIADRFWVAHYIGNQALYTFSKYKSLTIARDGKVALKGKATGSKPMVMPQRDFVIQYLINPISHISVQFRGRGFLNGRSTFAAVTDAVARLYLKCEHSKDKPSRYLLDLPLSKIKERALAFRTTFDTGDDISLRKLMSQYSLGDPVKEWEKVQSERKRKRDEYRAKQWKKSTKMKILKNGLDKRNIKKRNSSDDESLMQYD